MHRNRNIFFKGKAVEIEVWNTFVNWPTSLGLLLRLTKNPYWSLCASIASWTTIFLPFISKVLFIVSTAFLANSGEANSTIPHPRGCSDSFLKSSTWLTSPTSFRNKSLTSCHLQNKNVLVFTFSEILNAVNFCFMYTHLNELQLKAEFTSLTSTEPRCTLLETPGRGVIGFFLVNSFEGWGSWDCFLMDLNYQKILQFLVREHEVPYGTDTKSLYLVSNGRFAM